MGNYGTWSGIEKCGGYFGKGFNMTVKEMKEVLEQFPDECELFGTDGHNWFSLDFPVQKNETDIVFYTER